MEQLDFAIDAAKKCGNLIREAYHSEVAVETKGALDFVTRVDRECETLIREAVKAEFPEHGVLGEEFGAPSRETEYVWVVDPLDGTSNFVHRIPFFAVSIALKKGGNTVLGVVHNPMTGEIFHSVFGKGAYLDGKRLSVRKPGPMDGWFLAYCFRDSTRLGAAERKVHGSLFPPVGRLLKLGSAALELCYAASSRVDGYIGLDLKEWDYAAGELIAKEAGAEVLHTKIEGKSALLAAERTAMATIRGKLE
ncbi:MAG: inositol monophosphatase family protein [Candidatus Micrarchaeota archaeon]